MSDMAKKIPDIGNCTNPKTSSCINIQSKLIQKNESTIDTGSEFENEIKILFQQRKFIINNQYDHNGVENFLKEKDECLRKMEMVDDSILYKNLDIRKKSKNKKNRYKSHKNLKPININQAIKIRNSNQKVIDSFLSNKSGECIEEILKLLK